MSKSYLSNQVYNCPIGADGTHAIYAGFLADSLIRINFTCASGYDAPSKFFERLAGLAFVKILVWLKKPDIDDGMSLHWTSRAIKR